MFEQSFMYNFIKSSNLPLISRHNRAIYQQEPAQIDGLLIFRRAVFAAMAGYIVGSKILKNKESIGAIMGASLVVLYHIGVDYGLKK